jgi:hypothetical protein
VAKEHFRSWKPYPHSVERLEKVQAIIAEYKAQDLTLSLRQIFCQFVARDWLKNNMAGYHKQSNQRIADPCTRGRRD